MAASIGFSKNIHTCAPFPDLERSTRTGISKRAQISRLERGYSITIPTMRRVFKALGVVTATIDLGVAGKVALW